MLIDPNTFAAGGTDSVGFLTISPDGRRPATATARVAATGRRSCCSTSPGGEKVADAVIQTKFSEATWLPDSESFLYIDFPHEGHARRHPDGGAAGGASSGCTGSASRRTTTR